MYGEIILESNGWFIVKWYDNPTVGVKYYRDTEEGLRALYKVVVTRLNS